MCNPGALARFAGVTESVDRPARPARPTSPLTGKNILVTGGSGAFGQAFVRRALDAGAARVVVFSRSESKQAEMKAAFADHRLRFFIGDVRDQQRLVQAMRGVDTVVHAGALKRIETCQSDPGEAMLTNIVGTYNVAQAAITCGVQRAAFLSTDKSASASTVYGASKLFGEGLWNAMNALAAGTPTILASTRYGNVAGSTGSVIPIWRAQADRGEPLTITDVRMSRFFMRLSEAVDLVVLALAEMRGGEVFIPIIRGARLTDLAEALAPGAEMIVTGIRGAEKLHETLIAEDEIFLARRLEKCYILCAAQSENIIRGVPVSEQFRYRSDLVDQMSVEDLRALVA